MEKESKRRNLHIGWSLPAVSSVISARKPKSMKCYLLSRVLLFVTLWTVVHQAPLSMEFSRQEYWSGLPFSPQGIFLTQGSEPRSPASQADSLPSESIRQSNSCKGPLNVRASRAVQSLWVLGVSLITIQSHNPTQPVHTTYNQKIRSCRTILHPKSPPVLLHHSCYSHRASGPLHLLGGLLYTLILCSPETVK